MKIKTKMLLCLVGLLFSGILYQVLVGNEGAFLVGLMVLFAIGFSWYGCKLKLIMKEEAKNER